MNLGGVISDQLLNDIQIIWPSGYTVKARTNTSAGARYARPIQRPRLLRCMITSRGSCACGGRAPRRRHALGAGAAGPGGHGGEEELLLAKATRTLRRWSS